MFKQMTAFGSAFAAVFFTYALAQEPADALSDVAEVAAPAVQNVDFFTRDDYALTTIICPFKGEIEYKPGEISCGMLSVPENREKPQSNNIQLHYVKIAAREPEDWDAEEDGEWSERDDPIIYLSGGPGAQAAGYVKRFKDHGIRDHRDLYILEQRGVGNSQDFCLFYGLYDPSASDSGDYLEYQAGGIEAMEACFQSAAARGVDLSGYNTIENARDVKALRRALGFEQWNVWGISYGSILAQAYLREDPDAVRAAVIDAIVPLWPGAHFQTVGDHYARDLDLLQEACRAQPTCAEAFPNFVDRFKAAIIKVQGAPIEIDAIDTELFPSGKAHFFHDLIGALPFIQLYEQDNYATLPAFISALATIVEEEDYEALRIFTASGGGGGFSISQGMYNAIACNDDWVGYLEEARERDYRDYPALGSLQPPASFVPEMMRICRDYGMQPRPPEDFAPLETDIRALLVEGQMDPITPPTIGKLIVPGFSNGTYVEFPYAGHGPTRSVECAGEFLTKFYDDPDGELDLSCVETMEAPKFVGKLFETRGHMRIAALAAEDQKKVAIPALWFGAPALILIIGALVYTLAPVARLINRTKPGALPTSGARPLAWLTAVTGAASVIGLGYAGYASFEANNFLLLVGMLPWARWFAVAGLAAGVFGLGLLWMSVRARANAPLPIGVLLGLVLTAVAGVALAAFLIVWGFAPF